jgi:hypothetical protein
MQARKGPQVGDVAYFAGNSLAQISSVNDVERGRKDRVKSPFQQYQKAW